MKTVTLCGLLILINCLAGSAQIQPRRWTVGAQIGNLTYQNQNGGRTFTASLSPVVGYFIATGLVVGAGVPVSTGSQKSTADNSNYSYSYKTSSIGLAPFIRYYFGPHKVKPYLGLAYSYSKLKTKTTQHNTSGISSSEGTGKSTSLVPTLGVAYFIDQHLALTAGLNYTMAHQDQESISLVDGFPPSTNSYSVDNKTLSLSIGFQLFIGQ